MTAFKAIAVVTVLSLQAFSVARADYLVSPAGGVNLFNPAATWDDSNDAVTLPFTFNFYGTNHTTLDVSTNGLLSFTPYTAYSNGLLANQSIAQIDPLWDDLYLFEPGPTGSETVTAISTAAYEAITWNVSVSNSVSTVEQFQAVLFGQDTYLDNTQFYAGDIAFSYETVTGNFASGNATVGITDGTGNFSTIPGLTSSGGVLTSAQAALLKTTSSGVIVFSPDSIDGGFTVKVVPEPSTYLLLGVGTAVLAFAGRFFRRLATR